jgi:hypothetical protein
MKITSFNPMIITANADDIIKTFLLVQGILNGIFRSL